MPKKKIKPRTVEAAAVTSYKHKDKRAHIPTQEESVKLSHREKQPVKKKYDYDPSLDPQLVWSGKKEAGSEFAVSTVPVYVQEKISPEAIIARLKQGALDEAQYTLFGETTQQQFDKVVEFYKHEDNWQNRMILGDSLLVMNSLLEKEGMRGKVQCIYIDPPYGIKFGSNWQTSTRKRDVKDNKIEDMVRQPEQIKAFRDTWELGIHSYLSYLRDRLIVARELLIESGSCFLQISDDNVHLVRNVMDEVFGSENYVQEILFSKKNMPLSGSYLFNPCDYILWYTKNKKKNKYRKLFEERIVNEDTLYNWGEFEDGTRRSLTGQELKEIGSIPRLKKLFLPMDMRSSGYAETMSFPVEIDGKKYHPSQGKSWKTTKGGIDIAVLISRRPVHTGRSALVYAHEKDR